MSDFAQSGLICTLQRLNDSHFAQIEAELVDLAAERPIVLVLPCHGAELERPALRHICEELSGATWLHEVIVSMNGLGPDGVVRAREFFSRLPQRVRILWNDGATMREPIANLLGCAPEKIPHGKGLNVWAAIGVAMQETKASLIATQDCDVTSFRRSSLARLCYACVHPHLGFAFAKMYYSRVTDRLYGRVSRLFLAPLLQALLRVSGHQPLLDFLLSFRYPLAGECAMARESAVALELSPGWGLEIGMLSELFRMVDPRKVCQVDGGSGYDHKHQPVELGLLDMCRQITVALFAQLAAEGMTSTPSFHEAVAAAYRRESALALRRSAALALINGLPFDEAGEEQIVRAFAGVLETPVNPLPILPLPAWSRLLVKKPSEWGEFFEAASRW